MDDGGLEGPNDAKKKEKMVDKGAYVTVSQESSVNEVIFYPSLSHFPSSDHFCRPGPLKKAD